MKRRLLLCNSILLIAITLYACKKEVRVDYQSRTKLTFQQLPDTVQKLYIYFETSRDSIKSENKYYACFGCHWDTLLCLDKSIKKASHTRKRSWWYAEHTEGYYLTFDKQVLFLSLSNEREDNLPYILNKKQLYVLCSHNLVGVEEYKSAEYAKYDLSTILNP